MTWKQVKQQDAKDYNKYYNDQLIEILGNDKYGNKGHFKEVWMDGAKGSGAGYQEYDFKNGLTQFSNMKELPEIRLTTVCCSEQKLTQLSVGSETRTDLRQRRLGQNRM